MTTEINSKEYPLTTKHRPKGVDWVEVLDLKKKGLSHTQIAKLLDCSRQNVDYLVKQYGKELEGVETYRKNKADLLASREAKLLAALNDEKVQQMSGRDIAVAYGVLFDKSRLEEDKSTANVSYAQIVKAACEDN